jgi:hypothetical protein
VIYKRGKTYWTKFQHAGRMIYKSTGQTSATKARQCEAKLRSELAMGNFGILARKAVPTLAEFCSDRVEPWAKSTFGQASSKRWPQGARVLHLQVRRSHQRAPFSSTPG